MKKKLITTLRSRVAIGVFATFGVVGAAHADWTNPYAETGISGTRYFSNFGAGGQLPTFDQSHYDRVNLGPLSASLWAPKRGAQGPMREDAADRMAMGSSWAGAAGRDRPARSL